VTAANPEPASRGRSADVKAALRRHRPDEDWTADLAAVRALIEPNGQA
jgi:hypothetical protein